MNDIVDGVYFNLPDYEYHSIPALSASGIKNLMVSPLNYWANCSWLNPNYKDETTDACRIGRAFHKRILEGKALFYSDYAIEFQPSASMLKTNDELKEALDKCGAEYKKSWNKDKLIEVLSEADPSVIIYEVEKEKHLSSHDGKEFLTSDLLQSIEIAAAMIENHPHISKCFKGGFPEVSVIWTENGVRMKARFDYLKTKAIVDLKTFGNTQNRSIERAIYTAMASGKYHIQASFYIRAAEMAKRLAKWHGCLGEFRQKFFDCEEQDFYFVFQSKGIAPIARAYKFPRASMYQVGCTVIEDAINRYKDCMERFGSDPWIDDAPIGEFYDDQFPAYATEL